MLVGSFKPASVPRRLRDDISAMFNQLYHLRLQLHYTIVQPFLTILRLVQCLLHTWILRYKHL